MDNDIEMVPISRSPSKELPPVPKQPSWLRFLRSAGERIRSKPHRFTFSLYILSLVIISCVFWKTNKIDPKDQIKPYDNGDGIVLLGYPLQVDSNLQSVPIQWQMWGCGAYNTYGFPGCDMGCSQLVDVYFDGSPTPIFSYDKAKYSIYQTSNVSGFSVGHQMQGLIHNIPFDAYNFNVVVFVFDRGTNKSVPILGIVVNSQVQNFDVTKVSEGNFVGVSNAAAGTIPMEDILYVAFIEVRRSTLARVFTICLLIINWALTSVSVWVTMVVYFRREKPGDAVLLFPLTLVVTIPALRNLYIGSPPFGIFIDLIGFFPQMMIVGVCSVFLFWVGARATFIDRPDQSGPVQIVQITRPRRPVGFQTWKVRYRPGYSRRL